ncbi:hypothetical protein J2Z79_000089 [Symbiobacterium terraclitae]|uniref:Lipoprotein n=1 Tax=Symbiobacterium terraclitae TaxID=557451 RepID=A0ABS4JP01_9FIRM|nr:hypothetical protein [Symbiobacterium terraclitae]
MGPIRRGIWLAVAPDLTLAACAPAKPGSRRA